MLEMQCCPRNALPHGCVLLWTVLQETSVLMPLFWVPAQRTSGGTGLGRTWVRSLSAPALSALSAGSKGQVPMEEQNTSWPCMSLLLSVSRPGLAQGNRCCLALPWGTLRVGLLPLSFHIVAKRHGVRRRGSFAPKPLLGKVE